MAKPFTTLTAIIILIGAAVHAYRLYSGFPAVIDGFAVPVWASGVIALIAVFLGAMLLREARR